MPLSAQKTDPNSIYNHYKQWIKWRRFIPALSTGDIEFIKHDYPNVLAFMRFTDNQRMMVIHNLGADEVEIRIVDEVHEVFPADVKIEDGKIRVGGRKSVMLHLK